MFVKKDQRNIQKIIFDTGDDHESLWLARRSDEFPNGMIRSVLCRDRQIQRLTNLKFLSLYGNDLVSIRGIGALKVLPHFEYLDLGNNSLTDTVPDELAQLCLLRELHLEDNQLTCIGEGITKLKNLRVLRLSNNKIEMVPDTIGSMQFLEKLVLQNNRIENLPPEIGKLVNLRYFDMRNNRLTILPDEIGNLGKLETLMLNSNRLKRFIDPSFFGNLVNLKQLNLRCNEFDELPAISTFLKECSINISNNPITNLPPEISNNVTDIAVVKENEKEVTS